jgi:hypothetical protein
LPPVIGGGMVGYLDIDEIDPFYEYLRLSLSFLETFFIRILSLLDTLFSLSDKEIIA